MEKETFEYTYSSKKQEEIEAIRKKYMPVEEDKMETLRKLDKSVENTGTITAIVIGTIGTLVFGTGMSLAMVWKAFFSGIVVGIIGLIVMAAALPLYRIITKKQRRYKQHPNRDNIKGLGIQQKNFDLFPYRGGKKSLGK